MDPGSRAVRLGHWGYSVDGVGPLGWGFADTAKQIAKT